MRFLNLLLAFLPAALSLGYDTPTKLGNFDSLLEGVYDVRLTCREEFVTPDCQELNRAAKLVVLNIGDTVAVSIGYPDQSLARYAFLSNQILNGGKNLKGNDAHSVLAHNGGYSEFEAEFKNGDKGLGVEGWIRDPRFLMDVKVSGLQLQSPGPFYLAKDTFPTEPTDKSFVGRFLVTGDTRIWILTVRKALTAKDDDQFNAVISDFGSSDGAEPPAGIQIRFQTVRLYRDAGILNLIAPLSLSNSYLKWVLALQAGDVEGMNLRGMMISSTGMSTNLHIQRIK